MIHRGEWEWQLSPDSTAFLFAIAPGVYKLFIEFHSLKTGSRKLEYTFYRDPYFPRLNFNSIGNFHLPPSPLRFLFGSLSSF